MRSGIVLSLFITLAAGCMSGEIVADDQPVEADVAYLLDEPDAAPEPGKIRFFCPGPLCVDECDGPSPNPCICDIVPKPAGCPTGPVSDHP